MMRLEFNFLILTVFMAFSGCSAPVVSQPVVVAPEAQPVAVVQVATPVVEPVVQVDPILSFAGTYMIDGQPLSDGCGGRIYLAARNVTIDGGSRSVFADVVNRTYGARVEGGRLIAEGHFEARAACHDSMIFERWILERTTEGLQGTLESMWRLPPDCQSLCTIHFNIRLLPTG